MAAMFASTSASPSAFFVAVSDVFSRVIVSPLVPGR
jgi:hypothetical protein